MMILFCLILNWQEPTFLVKTNHEVVLKAKAKKKGAPLATIPKDTVLRAQLFKGKYVRVHFNEFQGWLLIDALSFDRPGSELLQKYQQKKAQRRSGAGVLKQCGHVKMNGQQCLYKTADASGLCPEHQEH